jgi:predicted DNA-binding ribbon-helix-helix protein
MSRTASSSAEFYTLQVGPEGRFAVRGWNDQRVVSLHEKQREAVAAAKRLNLEGHATSPVELPEPVIYGATQRAEKDGMSVADWIASVVEDRVRNEELADRIFGRVAEGGNARDILDLLGSADADYFRARAARASGRSLGEILDQGRDNPPDPGDEL